MSEQQSEKIQDHLAAPGGDQGPVQEPSLPGPCMEESRLLPGRGGFLGPLYTEEQVLAYAKEYAMFVLVQSAPARTVEDQLLGFLEASKFHKDASHVPPDYRDGYNHALQTVIARIWTEQELRRGNCSTATA